MIAECLVVEFAVAGDDCPLARAARASDATADAHAPQLRADGNALLRFSSTDGDGLAAALDADDDIRYLHCARAGDRYNYRCLSKHPCVVHELVSAGLVVETLRYAPDGTTVTGAVVGHDVLRGVLEAAGETVGVTLRRVHPLTGDDDTPVAARWDLTPAQEDALRAAHAHDYFAVPRETTAQEVADDMGISKSAFLERLHRAQRSLLDGVL